MPAPERAWVGEIGRRMWRYLPLKVVGISAFMWAFFVAYFYLLRHPAYRQVPLAAHVLAEGVVHALT